MRDSRDVEIAIVGAGVIGLATALRLAAEGREVVLIDPNEPGSGASYGNAGTLADYACVPVGNPAVLKSLPQLLLGRDSPFAFRWVALAQLAPWLVRFVRQSLPAAARANAVALAGLLAEALPEWDALAAEAGATDLMRKNGCLYLLRNKRDLSGMAWSQSMRAELGAHQELLNADEVAALEPELPPSAGGGIYFPDAMNVTDPAVLMRRLVAAAKARGASVERARVTGLEIQKDRVRLAGPDFEFTARTVVIAAGARSRDLARQAGDAIPLDTERGYHLEFPMETPLLRRPVCPIDLGFYATPMAGRLRVAGTVELGGFNAPANPHRLALLDRGVHRIFPGLGRANSEWLGFRPSMPNSRPVIGHSRNNKSVIYAFGHGHLGLTLAAITSRLVAGMVAKRGNDQEIAPFLPDRFHH